MFVWKKRDSYLLAVTVLVTILGLLLIGEMTPRLAYRQPVSLQEARSNGLLKQTLFPDPPRCIVDKSTLTVIDAWIEHAVKSLTPWNWATNRRLPYDYLCVIVEWDHHLIPDESDPLFGGPLVLQLNDLRSYGIRPAGAKRDLLYYRLDNFIDAPPVYRMFIRHGWMDTEIGHIDFLTNPKKDNK